MAWHLMKKGDQFAENSNIMEFMIDSAEDIESPPDTSYSYAPGSIAYTAGFGKMYQSDASGSWVEMGV